MRILTSILLLLGLITVVSAFVPSKQSLQYRSRFSADDLTRNQFPKNWQRLNRLFSSESDDTPELKTSEESQVIPSATSTSQVQLETAPYPINLPSPILLATSMILAIAGAGKLDRG